jgi:hypothetical protein
MKKRIIRDIVIICIVGLLPLLWLNNNSVLLGHDAGLALDPLMHFLDRIHVWSQRFSIGTDQNGALLGAFFIHGFEALLTYLGFNLHWGQLIQFIFWFTLPGLSMYFFAYKMFSDKRYLPLIASIIYMLNFYILQGWFVAERTKFSIYIAFPLVLYFLIKYLTGKIGFLKTFSLTGIVLGIFNGGGSPPLYGGLVFAVLCSFVYINVINLSIKTLRKTIFYTIGVSIFYFLLNAYWLIPYFFYVSGFYSRDLANSGGTEGALSWAKYLSSNTTFINLFRGQGIPDWYLNPYHAYSHAFMKEPLLIIASFIFPILAFASILVIKTRRDAYLIYLFIFICLVGLLFSSGPESQFGFIYEFMVNYVPGFAMFRSAFFKFNYIVWFTYGLLIGFTLDFLLSKIEQKFFKKHIFAFSTIALVVFVIGYGLYHYPGLNGSFLDYSNEPGKELTTRIKVPEYIFDFGKWVNKQDPDVRFLVMPQLGDTNVVSYTWHYWSIAPLTSLLSRNSFVHNTALSPEPERILMNEMYAAFMKGDMESFSDFTEVFAIDRIVLQKDYDWQNLTWGTVNPEKLEAILKSHPELFTHEKTFGKWEVYKIADRTKSLRINSSSKLSFLQGKLGKVVSFPYFSPKSPLFISDVENKNIDYYAQNASEIFLAPECIQCDLEYKEGVFTFYNPKLLPGSIFYPLVTLREKQVKASSNNYLSLINYYITISNRRIIEIKWIVDSRKRIEQILPTIERYKQTLRDLATELNKNQDATAENRAALMTMHHITNQVGLIDSIYDEDIMSTIQRDEIAAAYDEIIKIEKIAKNKLWVTTDMTNKKYIYDLAVTGEYDVYVKKGSLTNPEKDPMSTTIAFKDSPNDLKPIATVGDWLSFGKVNLQNKKNYIDLKDGTMSNLLDSVSPTFPDGSEGITIDKNNVTFNIDSLNKCFYYQFHDLEFQDTLYYVTFSYRNFSDNNTLSFFPQPVEGEFHRYNIKGSSLQSFRYFNKFTKLVAPAKDGSTRLVFCNGFLSLREIGNLDKQLDTELLPEGKTLIEIKNITFHKISYPNIVLYKKQKDIADTDVVKNFTKKDPVTYSVNVENIDKPTSLMMRESFGKYWRVCDEKNKCLSFDDKSHFSNSGFANAWYLKDEKLGNKLTIYYYPQRWYILGTILTFVSIGAIIVGWLCIRILKRK